MICPNCYGARNLEPCTECQGRGRVYCCDDAGAGIAEGGAPEWTNWADEKFPPRFMELAALLLGEGELRAGARLCWTPEVQKILDKGNPGA